MTNDIKQRKMITHNTYLCWANEAQIDIYLEYMSLTQRLLDLEHSQFGPQDVSKAMISATANAVYVCARTLGYANIGPQFKKEMLQFFAEALDSVDGDTEITQVMPH